MDLNEKQREAAEFLHGIASIIAVPGSGKTATMTNRIGILVKDYGIAPENILGLTFTRNAAQAMKDKLVPVLENLASRVKLQTLHSFCNSLLRQEGRTFEILFGKEQIRLLRRIIHNQKLKSFPTGKVLREISLAKNNLIGVDEFRSIYDTDETMLQVADAYEAYEREKRKSLLLDFDDLLVETYQLLKDNDEVREKYQRIFQHLLIDEFQDINPVQMEILKLLMGEAKGNGTSFWICGDDSQSIYAFTGASVSNILNFKRLFPESKEYILNESYRSTPQIIEACQNLIRHNMRRIHKTIETENGNGEPVIVMEAVNEEDEAVKVVNEIIDLVEWKKYSYKDLAILYRANYQSRPVEEKLSEQKIPYHVEGGQNFYGRFEVKILLDYLRLIHTPDSDEGDEALRSIINFPNRYIGRKFIAELETYGEEKDFHLYKSVKSIPVEVPYLKRNVKEFIRLIDPLTKDAGKMEPAEIIHVLRESLDYDKAITDDDVPSPDDSKITNVNQLQMVARKYKDIPSLLNYTDSFQDSATQDKNGVSLMTIHKSKGLEFPITFVIGCVEGVMPNKNGDIEEERRIAFVALSRAMKKLYLSYSMTFMGKQVKKSRFLDEIIQS